MLFRLQRLYNYSLLIINILLVIDIINYIFGCFQDPWMDFVDTSKAVYESAQMTSEWMSQMTEGSHGNRSPDLSLHQDIASGTVPADPARIFLSHFI